MKKALAFLLSFAIMFTAFSGNIFAAEPPEKIYIIANATKDNMADFAVKLEGFTQLKAIDITITGVGVTFADSLTGTGLKTTLTKDTNYTVNENKNEIHVVDLIASNATQIVIKGTAILQEGTLVPKIMVDANNSYLAKDTASFYNLTNEVQLNKYYPVAPHSGVLCPEAVAVTGEGILSQPTDRYFIPRGCVFDKDNKSIAKNDDGSFSVSADCKYYKFPIPDKGIISFGASETTKTDENGELQGIQFGNYVNNYDPANKKYGSLIIVGKWDEFVAAYQEIQPYLFTPDILERLYTQYDAYVEEHPAVDHVKFVLNRNKANEVSIYVYKVPQTKFLWKDASTLEYAVRVLNLAYKQKYAAVAYSVDTNGNLNFSIAVKTQRYWGS